MDQTYTDEDLKRAAIVLARESMAAFGSAVIDGYSPTPYQVEICNALQAVEEGKVKRLIITAPPQHMKSLHSSIIFPSYCLGRNPKRRIIESSFSGNIASRFGRHVRNISQLPLTRRIFPDLILSEDSQAKNKFDTTKGGYYVAAGRDGSITSYGADIMILDDMYSNKQEANSEVIRENIWDTYLTVYKTRLNKDSALVLLQTRWHDDDLIGKILRLETDQDWTVIEFPAIATKDDKFRKKGEALWPEKYPVEYLESQRALDPDVFSCMYQCTPLNEENAEFKRAWFKYFDDEMMPSNLRLYLTIDPAISKKDEADETSLMVTGMAPDRSIYVLQNVHGKMDPSELIDKIFELAEFYSFTEVGVETVAYQQALSHFLKKEMLARYKEGKGKLLNIREIKTRTEKEQKIRGLIAYYKNGMIYHRKFGLSELESQMLRFPKGAHDDSLDSLAMAIEMWEAPVSTRADAVRKKPVTVREAMKEDGLI